MSIISKRLEKTCAFHWRKVVCSCSSWYYMWVLNLLQKNKETLNLVIIMNFTSYAWILAFAMYLFQTCHASLPEIDYDEDDDEYETADESTTTEEINNSEVQFTFGDDDAFGPLRWINRKFDQTKNEVPVLTLRSLESVEDDNNATMNATLSSQVKKLYAKDHCQTNWLSPINIETRWVRKPELRKTTALTMDEKMILEEIGDVPETLVFTLAGPNIQDETWAFGHPTRFHGFEIRSDSVGLIRFMDNFDPLSGTTSLTSYDFHFLSIFYCDLRKALPHRTMHQLDGRKFPLELEYVFLRKVTDEEKAKMQANSKNEGNADDDDSIQTDSMSALYDGNYIAIIVSVLGEIGPEDNKYFQPVVQAAQQFHGKDFKYDDIDYRRNVEIIGSPWSPTWLLPDSSGYYYYNRGSFPVPPCWSVARFYIMLETIKISQSQLDTLTHIQTDREKGTRKLLPCTHSAALGHNRNGTLVSGESPVNLNLIEYEMQGEDGKPRSQAEEEMRATRKRTRDIFRKRLLGSAARNGVDDAAGNDAIAIHDRIFKKIVINLLIFTCVVFKVNSLLV